MAITNPYSMSLFKLEIFDLATSLDILSFENPTLPAPEEKPKFLHLADEFEQSRWMGMASSFAFHFKVQNKQPKTSLLEALNKQAKFEIGKGSTSSPINYFYGIISKVEKLGSTDLYHLTLSSPLFALRHNAVNRTYVGLRLDDIIKEIFTRNGFHSDEFRSYINNALPQIPLLVQYNENDEAFLLRVLAYWGIVIHFKQTRAGFCVVFYDSIDALSKSIHDPMPAAQSLSLPDAFARAPALPFVEPNGTGSAGMSIYQYKAYISLLTKTIVQHSYNPANPNDKLETTAQTKSTIPAAGTIYYPAAGYLDSVLGQNLAQRRIEAIDAKRKVITLVTDYPFLVPGQLITMSEHPITKYNASFRIIKVKHEGSELIGDNLASNDKTGLRYKNTVIAIPIDMPYRPPYIQNTDYQGYVSAKIKACPGQEGVGVYLTENGEYYIRYHFDDTTDSFTSTPTRRAQPLSGEGYGFHFPLEEETDVVIACQNGDLNQPIIMGVIPNPKQQSPVTSANPTQHILSTKAGHALLMDDEPSNPRIQLGTKDGKNRLELNATPNQHSVKLVSEQGDIKLQSAQNLSLHAQQNINKTIGGNHTVTVQGRHTVIAKEGNINLQSGGSIKQVAVEGPMMLTAGRDMNVNVKNSIEQIGGSQHLTTLDGNINITHEQGGVYAKIGKALNIIGTGQGEILFKQGNSYYRINADGSVDIKAKTINLVAEQNVIISGANVQHNGVAAAQEKHIPIVMPPLFNDEDYNLFVATVYGETINSNVLNYGGKKYYSSDAVSGKVTHAMAKAGKLYLVHSSPATWQAVASVIKNRVGTREWAKYTTTTQIIENTGFDAYTLQNIPFTAAKQALDTHTLKAVKAELKLLEMYELLEPIYKQKQVTTDADHYYSPLYQLSTHANIPPTWAKNYISVTINGALNTDDFQFFKVPQKNKVENK